MKRPLNIIGGQPCCFSNGVSLNDRAEGVLLVQHKDGL